MDGTAFAEGVAVADDQVGRFADVFEVLSALADGGEWEEIILFANGAGAFDNDVRFELTAVADSDLVADDAVGSDGDVGTNGGAVRYDGCRVNHETK